MLSDQLAGRFLVCLLSVSFFCNAMVAEAQESEDRTKFAVTEIRSAGSDIFFQGEYTGNITTTLAQTHFENYGLQVEA